MNKTTLALLASLTLGSLTAISAQAQATPAAPAPIPGIASTNRPAMRDRTEIIAQRLGLTPEQKQKVKPVFEEETKKLQEMRKDGNVKPEDLRSKYMAIREETNAKLKGILTPEQYDKYTKPFGSRTNAPLRVMPAPPAAPAPAPAPAK